MKVYLIMKDGPEWNTVVEIHADQKVAKRRTTEIQNSRNMKDVFDRLSDYSVEPHNVLER